MSLQQIIKVPAEKRDHTWSETFFSQLLNEKVQLLSHDPQQGPDGFPYLLVTTYGKDLVEKPLDLFRWCSQKGVGVVVNPTEQSQDYIFTFGMIWNFFLRGEFLTESSSATIEKNQMSFQPGETLFTGVPNESYWPTPVRQLFKEFLIQQGVLSPKVILLLDRISKGSVDFCFSLESFGQPPEPEWNQLLEAFSWFFPSHYSLAFISEKSLKNASFLSF